MDPHTRGVRGRWLSEARPLVSRFVSTAVPTPSEPSPPWDVRIAELPGRGRGIVAARAFVPGEVVERAPVLVVPRRDLAPLRGTLLDDYWFWWDEEHNACALGWAALYNHACPANATFTRDAAARTLVITVVAAIAAGDEITINYHGEPNDPRPVWFELAPPRPAP